MFLNLIYIYIYYNKNLSFKFLFAVFFWAMEDYTEICILIHLGQIQVGLPLPCKIVYTNHYTSTIWHYTYGHLPYLVDYTQWQKSVHTISDCYSLLQELGNSCIEELLQLNSRYFVQRISYSLHGTCLQFPRSNNSINKQQNGAHVICSVTYVVFTQY